MWLWFTTPVRHGELATLRSLDMLIEEEVEVHFSSLPKGFDPDLLVREKEINTLFIAQIAKAPGYSTIQFRSATAHTTIAKEHRGESAHRLGNDCHNT